MVKKTVASRRVAPALRRLPVRPEPHLPGAYGVLFRAILDGVRAQLPRVRARLPSRREAVAAVRTGDAPEMELVCGAQVLNVTNFINWGDTVEILYDCMCQEPDGAIGGMRTATAHFTPLGFDSLQAMLGSIVSLAVGALRPGDRLPVIAAAPCAIAIGAAAQDQLRAWADELFPATLQPGCRFVGEHCTGDHPVEVHVEGDGSFRVHVTLCGPCVADGNPPEANVFVQASADERIPAVHRSLIAFAVRLGVVPIAME
jgi:hypothetical protein